MFAWTLYAMCISLCLGLGAAAAERACRLRRRSTRWIWLSVMIAAVVVPAIISLVAVEIPQYSGDAAETVIVRLRDTTAQSLAPERWVADVEAMNTSSADGWFVLAWIGASIAIVLLLAGLCVHWFRRRRSWRQLEVQGSTVYVADDAGPAVVGFFRPCIVLPAWALSSPDAAIGAVLAHEREHIQARDPQLLLASLVFICVMPWNLPLWWVVLRLRRAIEVDCDARVVRGGHDAVQYGTLLLNIQQRGNPVALSAVALTERRSFLETRIRLMLAVRSPRWRWSAAALIVASIAMLAVAAHISPPSFFASQRSVSIGDVSFDRLAGYYHFGGQMVMRVARDGEQRFVHLAGQRKWPITAQSKRRWVSKAPYGEYEFVLDQRGDAATLAFKQNGNAYTGRRVSAAVGKELEQAFAARVGAQMQAPGARDAVERVISQLQTDRLDYAQLMPGLAESIRNGFDGRRAELKSLGPLKALTFTGVTVGGSDVYKAQYEHGADEVVIRLAPDGRISRLSFDEWRSEPQKDAFAERVQQQKPRAGSEQALQRLIANLRIGRPNYDELSPGFGAVVRQQLPGLQVGAVSFGELRSITFDRVLPNGWDVFSVRFDNAVIVCSIELREDGKISGLLWDM
jgi:bla regulator protein BlaR1